METIMSGEGRLQQFSPHLCDERDVVLCALPCDNPGVILKHASERLRNDRRIVLAAVLALGGHNPNFATGHALPPICDDKKVALVAVGCIGNARQMISERLKIDKVWC